MRPSKPTDEEVLKLWMEWWYPLVADEKGIDPVKVAKELYDYTQLMENTSAVFDHITMGRISKPFTIARDVIAVHDEVCHKYCNEE